MNVLVARYLGKRDDSAVRDVVHSSLIICFAVGVLLLAAGIINVVLNLIFVIVFKRSVDGTAAFYMAWIYTVFAHFRTIFSLYLLYAFSWTITAAAEIAYFAAAYRGAYKQLKG